jgi:Secretion system C-terminal sorting domain
VLYNGIGECITCSAPLNFFVENVWDNYVKLRWSTNPSSPNPPVQYQVIYGPQGFDVAAGEGDTATTTATKITINGLQKKTWYDAYLEQDCGVAGGVSSRVGPIAFQTYWTKDVGVVGVVNPQSGCALGTADTVRILMKNFGAAPQSLIPFRFTVNGQEVNIPKPNDGVHTGVLGKDSVEAFVFETTFDFSESGEYKIVAYSKLTGDEDLSNDTFTYYITNRLLSPYQQHFETWGGGFTVNATGEPATFVLGTPNKPSIPAAASGQQAWVTSLDAPYNADEFTYLESSCFDFEQLSVDPVISFSIARDLESEYDAAWLEVSTDGGANWVKVGGIDEGLGWYNEDVTDGTNAGEAWSGFSGGWEEARHMLTGAAGNSEVRFRFAFASDQSVQLGGLGIDDVRIFPAFNKDLGGKSVAVASEGALCGDAADEVSFTFVNLGAQQQSNFQVAYAVNGGTPVVETVSGAINPDQPRVYTFTTTFDSRDALSVIKCWTKLAGEFAPANDTAVYIIDHRPTPTPFQEDFEDQQLPAGWTVNGFIASDHGNTSFVLASNLYSFNPEIAHTTPRYGLIGANDSLEFTYRITNYSGGATVLGDDDVFVVEASSDCAETYQTLYTIDQTTHVTSLLMRKVKISLADFAGESITLRFLGSWGGGDYWYDLDNINLLSCAADMALTAEVTPADPGQSNGSATVNVGLGNPPYTYSWSTGATTQTVDNLSTGTYTVTVLDDFGCSDSFEFSVGTSAVVDINGLQSFTLQPNPTTGMATFTAVFDANVGNARVQVLNLLGQPVWESHVSNAVRMSENIDLTTLPEGIYLVQLTVDGQVATKKLMKF